MAKVLLLYNAPALPKDHPDADSERELLRTVEAVTDALDAAKHEVIQLGLTDCPEVLLTTLRRVKPEVVFNLFEGFGHRPASEYHVAGMLEWLGIPYTGCPLESMVLGLDKVRTKKLLLGAGLPTAEFMVVSDPKQLCQPKSWPVMVKPAETDASVGIDQDSVVTDWEALVERVKVTLKLNAGPAMVETYLPGPEYNVGIVGYPTPRCLPIAEMVYTPQPGVKWPIVSYASKWVTGSAEDLAMQPRCPAQIDDAFREKLSAIGFSAYQLVGCRDYARVDMRLDANGEPNILEVNPNPDLDPCAGLARMLRAEGVTYEQFIQSLIANRLAT